MAHRILEIGNKIRWMVKDFIYTLIKVLIKDIMLMEKNKDLVFLFKQMVRNIKEKGKKWSRIAKIFGNRT